MINIMIKFTVWIHRQTTPTNKPNSMTTFRWINKQNIEAQTFRARIGAYNFCQRGVNRKLQCTTEAHALRSLYKALLRACTDKYSQVQCLSCSLCLPGPLTMLCSTLLIFFPPPLYVCPPLSLLILISAFILRLPVNQSTIIFFISIPVPTC